MSSRYFRRSEKQRIAELFGAAKVFDDPLTVDYNIAPGTFQPIIRLSRGSGDKGSGEREMVLLRWGMVPFFASSLKEFKGMTTYNARAESVATSATWREPLQRRRCLIPADGFYEWAEKAGETSRVGARARTPSGTSRIGSRAGSKTGKQPYAITLREDEPMAFAGLWDAWKEPKKSPQEVDRWLQSFAMVTTVANTLMATIHTRMPVILPRRDWAEWLERDETRPAPIHLLKPYPSDEMRIAPCNTALGNVRNKGPEMLAGPKISSGESAGE